MNRLKFGSDLGRNHVSLINAAVLLVINQEPWAPRVVCSKWDYLDAGYRPMELCYCVQRPGYFSFAPINENEPTEDFIHKFVLSMDENCPLGEVRLP